MATSFLNLYTTNSAEGADVSFLNWRLLQNGSSGSSNMTIIDNFASEVSASIVTLKSGSVTGGESHNHQGTSGSKLDHGLAFHSSTLSDDDHPIYLKAAGGRTATGSLVITNDVSLTGGLNVGYETAVSEDGSGIISGSLVTGGGIIAGSANTLAGTPGAITFPYKSSIPSAYTDSTKLINISGSLVEVGVGGSQIIGAKRIHKTRATIFSPQAVQELSNYVILMLTLEPIVITRIHVALNTTGASLTGYLKHCPDAQMSGTKTSLVYISTVNGVHTPSANLRVAAGNYIYFDFNGIAPNSAITYAYIELYYVYL